ncbi:MAG: DUF885 domain-containing protein [Myxococcales bacterium]|nr:DUF885 domain-containing protein [Myxococcales bacterium]
MLPALRGYRNFLEREILPHSRNRPGVDGLRDGAACYQAMIASHTGLEETPEAIHQLGLQEVARIQAEMQTLATEMGAADPAALMAALDARPDQHAADAEALLAYNRDLLARAQAALPRAFGRLPKTPIELKALEAFRAADAPAAYYYGAPDDGSRPAYYYLNTHDATERLLYQMPALAFHEAVPGHHLQIALAKETLDLPMFMRESGNSAFTEGWALYAERLARELDLYRTPEERFGALTYEIWRAARLVVDTGLHAKGWRRQEAIDYLNGLLGHDEGEIINEVDRYIAWPGQALAYKVGELEIRRLRAEAEAARGTNFDLRAFHDRVLRNGSVPLRVLRADIEAWLKE